MCLAIQDFGLLLALSCRVSRLQPRQLLGVKRTQRHFASVNYRIAKRFIRSPGRRVRAGKPAR
jgi:hypothetical protein